MNIDGEYIYTFEMPYDDGYVLAIDSQDTGLVKKYFWRDYIHDGSFLPIFHEETDWDNFSFDPQRGILHNGEVIVSLQDFSGSIGLTGWNEPEQNIKYQTGGNTSMLTVAGTLIGFGAFGYSVVKLTQKDWRSAAITGVGGIAVLSLVGWNLRKMTGFNAPTRNFMKRSEVEKILDASQGKIVGVTFIKKDGSERTLVGRIQKRYSPPGGPDPLGGKAARRARGLFTIYDMQKGAFRMVNMETVLGIRAGGKTYSA